MPPPAPLEQVQRIVSRLRSVWPQVKILLRADSGFAREELLGWCEQHQVDYLFGLARNSRLQEAITDNFNSGGPGPRNTGGGATICLPRLLVGVIAKAARDPAFDLGQSMADLPHFLSQVPKIRL